ncbi:MAG: hypothetical protein VB084_13775 [Syntrophomonadaceae bacterium]|nr:hypothetical protein [Syntrophomonadaceae bacterium]
MDVFQVTVFILLGAILGSAGQGIRIVVGLKKNNDKGDKGTTFDLKQFIIGLTIGSIAGILGAISLYGELIDKQLLITLIAIGYAGTDFIEGFMKKKLPE